MRGLGVVGVIANYAIARVFPDSAVRRLLAAMSSSDEDTSMAAYMALVKLGPGNAKRVMQEMKKGRQTPEIIQLLGDLGDRNVIPYLEELTDSDDPRLASAAQESIEILRAAGANDGLD